MGRASTARGRSNRPGPSTRSWPPAAVAGRSTGSRSGSRTSSTSPACRRRRGSSPGPGPGRRPRRPIVAGLREAGAVILGKTVTTQFAWIDPPPTRNPWNLDRTPGGSSSGSAAAVALGMCLGADRHPDGRLDHPPGVVLRRCRAQAQPRRSRPRRARGDRAVRPQPRSPRARSPGPSTTSRSSSRSSAATGGMTRVVMTIGRPRPSPRWTSGSSATGKGHPGWAGSAASSTTGPTRRCARRSTGRSRRWPTPERAWARPFDRSKCPKSCATIA